MAERVHGHVFPSEHLTGKMDFFTVRTLMDIRPTGLEQDYDAVNWIENPTFPFTSRGVTYANVTEYNTARAAQRRFDKLNMVIALRAQPVVQGDVTVDAAVAPPVVDIPASGPSGGPSVAVYSYRFAVEHTMMWDPEDLAVALDGVEGFVFSLGDTSDNNVIVYRDTYLK